MKSFVAKLAVASILLPQGYAPGTAEEVTLRPQYTGSPEDNSFSAATPSGEVKLTITNPELIGTFQEGAIYEVLFTPRPATPGEQTGTGSGDGSGEQAVS